MATYKLLSELGHGGMGVVYRALQEPLGREVAVKFLLAPAEQDEQAVHRFRREIDMCVKLSHPGVIKILDAGEQDGKLYYVMEFLAGAVSLDAVIREGGAIPLDRAVDIAIQLLVALEYCHDRSILHRDLKPANVMQRPDGGIVLMDFGLGKHLLSTTYLTGEGAIVGTPRFLAPEILMGGGDSKLGDIWAVGVTLYELLTGCKAFDGGSVRDVAAKILRAQPVPVHEIVTAAPQTLNRVLGAFMDKNPARRVASAADGAQLLRAWLQSEGRTVGTTGTFQLVAGSERRDAADPVASDAPTADSLSVVSPGQKTASRAVKTVSRASESGVRRTRSKLVPVPDAAAARWSARHAIAGSAVLVSLLVCWHIRPAKVAPAVPGASIESPAGVLASGKASWGTDSLALSSERIGLAAAALRRSLDALRPAQIEAELIADWAKAYSARSSAEETTRRWEPVRQSWESRARSRVAAVNLDAEATRFEPLRAAFYEAPDISGREKRDLFEKVIALRALEETARALKVPWPGLASRLLADEYGPVGGPLLDRPSGVLLMLTGNTCPEEEFGAGKPLTIVTAVPQPQDALLSRGGPDGTENIELVSKASYEHKTPLPAMAGRASAPLELRAMLHLTPPEREVRVEVCEHAPLALRDWKLLAVMRSRSNDRHMVVHRVPAGILPDGQFWLRVRLQYSHAERVRSGRPEQRAKIQWLFLATGKR